MYIDVVPNRKSPPAVLLREAYREGGKVKKRTIANLSAVPAHAVDALRQALRSGPGQQATGATPSRLRIERSKPHGHVRAVLAMLDKLGLAGLISSRPGRQRDLIVGLIASRLLFARSKRDTVVRWNDCTLADELGIGDADEDEVYAALDWIAKRQQQIESRLAKRHLEEGSCLLYDLSSSYYTGSHCSLAKRGHNRDGKSGPPGVPIIVYGVLADSKGRPISVQVHPGNTADPSTVAQQADAIRKRFGMQQAILVGDRGCISSTNVDKIRQYPGLGWIGALKSQAIRQLVAKGNVSRSLFDDCQLGEIQSDLFPGERLIACFNPLLAEKRHRTRQDLLAATENSLQRLQADVARRTSKPLSASQIGVKAGKMINRYKVGKHFKLTIEDGKFDWRRNEDTIRDEQLLDGLYIIRTSESATELSTKDAVRTYKSLAQVEQAFRCLKTVDLRVRPIYLRTEAHVKAHIFLCVLSYYVEWHLRQAWSDLLFADDQLDRDRWTRDPVAPAEPSDAAKAKKKNHRNKSGQTVQSFNSLLNHLATLTRNTCTVDGDKAQTRFTTDAEPTNTQQQAFTLINQMTL